MTIEVGERTGRTDQNRYLKLLPLNEVKQRIRQSMRGCKPRVQLLNVDLSEGRICAENVAACWNIPQRDVAAMDGYAIQSGELQDVSSNPINFKISGSAYPGEEACRNGQPLKLGKREACLVTTGAPLPEGADAVARLEDTRLVGDGHVIVARKIPRWKNVMKEGEDVKKGQIVLVKGSDISPAEVALLIAVGRKSVKVFEIPRIGILSVGDEMRKFRTVTSGARRAKRAVKRNDRFAIYNNYYNLIQGYLLEVGSAATSMGVCRDKPRDISRRIDSYLGDLDMVITIGGTSVGRRDFTPEAVRSITGSDQIFHGVRMLPIKPTGLCMVKRGGRLRPVAILPGHSVSAALAFFVIVLPVLNLISGLPFEARRVVIGARSTREFSNDRAIASLFVVKLIRDEQIGFHAEPLRWGSNLLQELSKANGFVELPPKGKVLEGESIPITLLGEAELGRIDDEPSERRSFHT